MVLARLAGFACVAVLVGGGAEVVGVLDHVGRHRIEPGRHLGQIGMALADLLQRVLGGHARHRAVHLAHALGVLLAQPHRGAQRAPAAPAPRPSPSAARRAVLRAGLSNTGGGITSPSFCGATVKPTGVRTIARAAALRLVADLDEGLLALLELGVDALDLGGVLPTRTWCGSWCADRAPAISCRHARPCHVAGRQLECERLVRRVEAVDVDPVAARDAVVAQPLLHRPAHQRAPPLPGGPATNR